MKMQVYKDVQVYISTYSRSKNIYTHIYIYIHSVYVHVCTSIRLPVLKGSPHPESLGQNICAQAPPTEPGQSSPTRAAAQRLDNATCAQEREKMDGHFGLLLDLDNRWKLDHGFEKFLHED